MREGKYIIDSIENGWVKLLLTENEEREEVVKKDQFTHPIHQGDVLLIKIENNQISSTPLIVETENRRNQAASLMEKLIKKNR
ncbi:DUF3006 domain-containing protein [Niallia endozanthoxylica]|uniref:DUF3006 domain-containing protein n=1 Tax=Niallia endozanthoxylica TaxID=2036016 RepID=A0A5J5HQ39_9BACI|nr:DUF3006 domain-containing protein [Niallia endozanthoxylica]KAA9022920.1 DUF3006 domain-containing protein [Niallia endozanthoxylica]